MAIYHMWRNNHNYSVDPVTFSYTYEVFQTPEGSVMGAYVSGDNFITIVCGVYDEATGKVNETRLVSYQYCVQTKIEGYVQTPLKSGSTFSHNTRSGYPEPRIQTGSTQVIDNTDIPIFQNLDDMTEYFETGDDSGALNYDELHGTKCDFYLTNNGDAIRVQHKFQDEAGSSSLVSSVKYIFTGGGPSHVVQVGADLDLNTSWSALGVLPTTTKLSMQLSAYNNKGVQQCTLTATITRKLVGALGDITAIVNVGEDNGYRLFATTNNEFDDIEVPEEDGSDAGDNPEDGSSFGGFSNLCATYKISKTALNDLGDFIWQDDLFKDIKLMNNSPIENIISLMYMPVNFEGTQTNIVLGNIDTKVSGIRLTQNMVKKNVATFTMPAVDSTFLSYEPYTSVALYLPLVGMIDLSAKDCCGYTISIDYVYDLVVGTFGALVYTSKGGGKTLIYSTQGTCSIDIPLTASNKSQVQTALLQNGASLLGNAIGGNAAGALNDAASIMTVQNHSSTFGSPSSMVGALSPTHCYYILRSPITCLPSNFAHTKGWMCMQTYTLSELKGFTKLTTDIDLSGISATDIEKEQLVSLLTSGVYL